MKTKLHNVYGVDWFCAIFWFALFRSRWQQHKFNLCQTMTSSRWTSQTAPPHDSITCFLSQYLVWRSRTRWWMELSVCARRSVLVLRSNRYWRNCTSWISTDQFTRPILTQFSAKPQYWRGQNQRLSNTMLRQSSDRIVEFNTLKSILKVRRSRWPMVKESGKNMDLRTDLGGWKDRKSQRKQSRRKLLQVKSWFFIDSLFAFLFYSSWA